MHRQTPSLAHVQFIPHTHILWLELQIHTLKQCSGYIFRSNASQYSPAEENALIPQSSCALVFLLDVPLCFVTEKESAFFVS